MNKLKKILPDFLVTKLVEVRYLIRLKRIYATDQKRFYEYSAHESDIRNSGNINSKLMYFTHQIEKGLSHEDFRKGFGRQVVSNLVEMLVLAKKDPDVYQNFFYQEGLSALKAYKEKHESVTLAKNESIPNFDLVPANIKEEISKIPSSSGVVNLNTQHKQNNNNIDFKTLALNRFSVRNFQKNASVEIEKIKEAIQISIKSPSVCNRQPARVKVITNQDLISRLLQLQGGFKGYNQPDKLLLITSDVTAFLRMEERNQAFIDGGLFSMSILYSLEYQGIGACALSTNVSLDKAKLIREILRIPENEVLIMFIACGKMEEEVLVPKSNRNSVDRITKIY